MCALATEAWADRAEVNPLDALRERGLDFSVEYNGEVMGNLSGGLRRGADYAGLLTVGLELDLEKCARWRGATLYVSAICPHGSGITDRYVGDFNVVSNIDAYDTVRLQELWVEHRLAGDRISVRAGQLFVDAEFFASERAALLLNSSFGVLPTLSGNVTASLWPVGGLGARVQVQPLENILIRCGVFDGDPGEEEGNNTHGTRFHWHPSAGMLVIAEIECSVSGERPGAYKFGGFYDSNEYPELAGLESEDGNGGVYVMGDQQLWREKPDGKGGAADEGLGAFFHLSAAPEDRSPVAFYFDCGFTYRGLCPGRDEDDLALGLSYTRFSQELGKGPPPVLARHETVLELTYRFVLSEDFYLQPDLQYIATPGGFGDIDDAFVAGVRANVSF